MEHNGEILLYQNTEGKIKLDVQLQDETVWLTQTQMSQLFGKAVSIINEHIKNTTARMSCHLPTSSRNSEFPNLLKNPQIFSNLNVIISVGHLDKSNKVLAF